MTRRFTCYVVFATLIWGAHTQKEEEVRGDMFKSNMTRNDFSNLLSSLIKLNEQRVSVLQRLHKLEDYGVLSEVLRSGDRESENGNPNNLFLIVMSKGAVDARTIVKNYQVSRDDGENALAAGEQPTENTEEMLNDLLGLVTLETDPATRRNIDMPENSTEFDGEEEDEYLRIDNPDINISEDLKDIVEPPAMRAHEENKNTLSSKIRRTECISANIKEIEKCNKACNRAHTDVCSRRSCSLRARKTLKTECSVNCKEVFDSKDCDY